MYTVPQQLHMKRTLIINNFNNRHKTNDIVNT